ncbi:MAG TPA: hypothetical protein EYH26_01025 [Pyrodictium sp.]|nr:hypothetical protein [Pyrodictium sp.]
MQHVYHDEILIPTIIPVATDVRIHRLVVEKERKLLAFLIGENDNVARVEYSGDTFNKVEYMFQNLTRFQCERKILTSEGIACISSSKLYHLYYDGDVVELPFSINDAKLVVGMYHIFLVKNSKLLHSGKIHIYSLKHNDIESFSVNANRIAYTEHATGSTIVVYGNNKFYTIFEKNDSFKIIEEKFAVRRVEVGPGIVLASNNKETIIVTSFKVEHIPVNLNSYRSTLLLCTPSWKFCIIGFDKDYLVGISRKNDIILRVKTKLARDHVWLDLKNDAIIILDPEKDGQTITVPEDTYLIRTSPPPIRIKNNSIYMELAKEQTHYVINVDTFYNFLPYTLIIKGKNAYIIDTSKYKYVCSARRKPKTNILIIDCRDQNIVVEVGNAIVRRDGYSRIAITLPYDKYPVSNIKIVVKDNILTTIKQVSLAHYPPKISISSMSKIRINLCYSGQSLAVWHYLKININYKNPYKTPIFITLKLTSCTHSRAIRFKLEKSGGQKYLVVEDNNYSRVEVMFANKLIDVLHVNATSLEKHMKIEILDIKPMKFSHTGKPTKFKIVAKVYDANIIGIGLGKHVWTTGRRNNIISFEVEEDLTNSKKSYLLVKLEDKVVKLVLHGLYNVILNKFMQNLASVILSELDIIRKLACYKILSEGYLILVDGENIIEKRVQKGETLCTRTNVKLICKDLRKIELPPLLTTNFKISVWLENNTIIFRFMTSSYNHIMLVSYANTIKFSRSTISVKVIDLLDAIKDGKNAIFNIFVFGPGSRLKVSVNFLKLLLILAFRAANALKTRI